MPAPRLLAAASDRIVALLADGTPRSTSQLADAVGADAAEIRWCLRHLVRTKRVVRAGGRTRPARLGLADAAAWTLPEPG